MSCVVTGEEAVLAPWAGAVEKAVWQLFLGQAVIQGFSDV